MSLDAQVQDLLVVVLKNDVVFPVGYGVFELSKDTFDYFQRCMLERETKFFGVVGERIGGKDISHDEVHEIGTYCRIISPAIGTSDYTADVAVTDGKVKVSVEGLSRFMIEEHLSSLMPKVQVYRAKLLPHQALDENGVQVLAMAHSLRETFTEIWKTTAGGGGGQGKASNNPPRLPDSPSKMADTVAATLRGLSFEERQEVLQAASLPKRLELLLDLLQREADAQRMAGKMTSSAQRLQQNEMRREMLERQIAAVRKDLQSIAAKRDARDAGEDEVDGDEDELERLSRTLEGAGLPATASTMAKRELKRLKSMQPQNPEYAMAFGYLETLASLPWKKSTEGRVDLHWARKVLDEDHQGLDKVKKRIMEHLAVQRMQGGIRGPILCLHGPPGIGKTSLGKSIARALGRKFYRLALGGVRDEAELRGHRRTYIGSIPGAIISAISSVGVNNPVILLDEVDKVVQNAQGNPQAALLEILDPEQNSSFKDHYLNTPFDLSQVIFICTANDTSSISRPLLDRMEVIELAGYTVEEKISIAESHLLPKQRRAHALEHDGEQPLLALTSDALPALVTGWTAESGVRDLERRLAQICRWAVLRLQGAELLSPEGGSEQFRALSTCGPTANGQVYVGKEHLEHIVGAELFEADAAERLSVGVGMGLSVSAVGGALLFVEAARCAGSGLTITGQLGSVMSESVSAAMSLLRGRYAALAEDWLSSAADVGKMPFQGEAVHVHFPAGGVPKDGPSAGVVVLLALTSLLLDRPMRSDTAVTGEISLRGQVLPIGGVRDKLLAAQRAGLQHVMLPHANRGSVLDEVPASSLQGLELHFVKNTDEALSWAFGFDVTAKLAEREAAVWGTLAEPSGVPIVARSALLMSKL